MKNLENITNIEAELSSTELERLEGIALGMLRFNRMNNSDMPLMVKIMYQFMNNKKCPSGYEHDAIAYIRDNLHNRDNLDFDIYATMNKQESNA